MSGPANQKFWPMVGWGVQSATSLLQSGTMVGERYRVDSVIASGGMGVVYAATQVSLGRRIALKVLRPPRHPNDEKQQQRFLREAAAMAMLKHPNTVVLYDYGNTKGLLYLALELVEGETLGQHVRQNKGLQPLLALRLATQIAGSLIEAHGKGLIHRDLKPSNVMLSPQADGQVVVKVLDFGLVKDLTLSAEEKKLTATGVIMGSPSYMAPEQIMSKPVDARTDIYAFGGLLCFMLTGQPPYQAASQLELMRAHLYSPPPDLESQAEQPVAQSLAQIAERCLEKEPERRYQSMGELLSALRSIPAGAPSPVLMLDSAPLADVSADAPTLVDPPRRPGEQSEWPSVSSAPRDLSTDSISSLLLRAAINPGRSPLAWTVRVLFAASLVGAGIGFALSLQPNAIVAKTVLPITPSADPVETTPAEPVAVPDPSVAVHLHATPRTAEITINGELLGTGQAQLTLPSGESWTVRVSAPGYRAELLVVDGTQSELRVTLRRRRTSVAMTAMRTPTIEPNDNSDQAASESEPEAAPPSAMEERSFLHHDTILDPR